MDISILKKSLLLGYILAVSLSQATSSPTYNGEHSAYNLTESEYLALEGGSILPDQESIARVDRDLSVIRANFPAVREIQHNRKWIPGQVLTTKINQDQLSRLNSSKFGPLKHVERIDVMPFFFVTLVSFDKPYSPPVISNLLESEIGVPFSPNTVYYEYEVDNIGYKNENSTYIFKKGTGMCKDNCSERYLWEFQTDESGNATLLREWTVPQNGERVVIV